MVADTYILLTPTKEMMTLADQAITLARPLIRALAFAVWAWGLLMLVQVVEAIVWMVERKWNREEK